jgi:hypothetical protein
VPGGVVGDAWSARLTAAVAAGQGAYAALTDWLERTYLPRAAAVDGVGREAYARALRRFLGSSPDLDETVRWGWDEVRALRARMEAAARRLDPDRPLGEVLHALQTEPAYAAPDADAFVARMVERQDAALRALDGVHFDVPAGIRRLDVRRAPHGSPPGAWYMPPSEDLSRPGAVWYSVPDGPQPMWDEVSTAYHEGFPGHHLQVGLQVALRENLCRVHRVAYGYSGFAEGWALYAEELMGELGYYERPEYELGMLANQMMRACRVVFDVGAHTHQPIPADAPFHPGERWSFELGVELMMDYGGMTRPTAESEVARYLGWPGQAPSYKLGQRVMLDTRREHLARGGHAPRLPLARAGLRQRGPGPAAGPGARRDPPLVNVRGGALDDAQALALRVAAAFGCPCVVALGRAPSPGDDPPLRYLAWTGLPPTVQEMGRVPVSWSPDALVLASGAALVVEDARRDARTAGLALVAHGDLGAYAGVPVRVPDEGVVGTLSVFCPDARPFGAAERLALELAGEAVGASLAGGGPARVAEPAVGVTVADRWRVTANLGSGGQGSVWLGVEEGSGRQVALKVGGQAIDEARQLATVSHPNLVAVHAAGALPGERSFLVMDHVDGPPLDEVVVAGQSTAGGVVDRAPDAGRRRAHRAARARARARRRQGGERARGREPPGGGAGGPRAGAAPGPRGRARRLRGHRRQLGPRAVRRAGRGAPHPRPPTRTAWPRWRGACCRASRRSSAPRGSRGCTRR